MLMHRGQPELPWPSSPRAEWTECLGRWPAGCVCALGLTAIWRRSPEQKLATQPALQGIILAGGWQASISRYQVKRCNWARGTLPRQPCLRRLALQGLINTSGWQAGCTCDQVQLCKWARGTQLRLLSLGRLALQGLIHAGGWQAGCTCDQVQRCKWVRGTDQTADLVAPGPASPHTCRRLNGLQNLLPRQSVRVVTMDAAQTACWDGPGPA